MMTTARKRTVMMTSGLRESLLLFASRWSNRCSCCCVVIAPSFARQQTFSRCHDYSTILCIVFEHVDLTDEILNLADRMQRARQLLAEENCHISILAQELLKSGN